MILLKCLKFVTYWRISATILTYFTLSQLGLCGHSYKLYTPNFRLVIRKFSFSVRVINKLAYRTYIICGLPGRHPNLGATAIIVASSDSLSPIETLGAVWSQSLEWGDEAVRSLALSFSDKA